MARILDTALPNIRCGRTAQKPADKSSLKISPRAFAICSYGSQSGSRNKDKSARIKTGLLGAEVSADKSGFFRLEKILPGASWSKSLRSPLTEPGIEAKAGEFIVAIDGVPTNSVKDMYSLLVGKAGVPTEILLNSEPQLEGARKTVISPLEEEYSLYHYNWVQDNIEKVDKASNGKIGYIYIPDMGPEGLNEFSRYFYPQLDKEGLIIDGRANGGGECFADDPRTPFP